MNIRIGTAGWSLSARYTEFDGEGTHLQRYALRLNAVEINSSFYRHHRAETYARWAASVPEHFRFCVKTPKLLTHTGAFNPHVPVLQRFAEEVAGLGPKFAVALVQLPPSLAFDANSAQAFLEALRERLPAHIACEPRHPTWRSSEADRLLDSMGVARVAADPARWIEDARPGGFRELSYFRFHGSPRIYYSDYEAPRLSGVGDDISAAAARSREVWCIFDNTALGHALGNALTLARRYI